MSSDQIKYSVVIPTHNNFNYLHECLDYVQKYSEKNTEIIIVDNASTDTTKEWLNTVNNTFRIVKLDKNYGFAKAVNEGIKIANGKWVVILNNDVLVTKGWLRKLEAGCITYQQRSGTKPASIAVPMSNYVGMQSQQHQATRYDFEEVAQKLYADKYKQIQPVGIASGMLMMINKEVFDKIGLFDERFFAGCEDMDFCVRAYEAGFVTIVCKDTFIYHYGSKTIDNFPTLNRGTSHVIDLLEKYSYRKITKQNLGVIYRVKIRDDYEANVFIRSLEKSSTFADHIFILDDNSPLELKQDSTGLFISIEEGNADISVNLQCKVTLQTYSRGFDERRDRNDLLKMAKDADMDWVLSLDADEIIEDKVDRKYIEKLINTPDPTAQAYSVHYYTFWNDEKHYNAGDVWNSMCGNRLVRLTDDPTIFLGSKSSFHVGNVPFVPPDFSRVSSIRIKHYGYVHPEQRQRKYEWYEKTDFDKNPALIGHEDYKHLINDNPMILRRWLENSTISLCTIMKNEQQRLFDFLRIYTAFVDETIIIDTGSTDKSIWMAELFGCKVLKKEWKDSFSDARNAGLDEVKEEWILHLDIDEHITDFVVLRRMLDVSENTSGYMFTVHNLMRNQRYSISETVRIFRRKCNFRYSGYVHETIDRDERYKIMRSPIPLYHYGYLKSDEELKKKMAYYFKLNSKQIEDFPKDPRPRYAQAIHFLEEEYADEAEAGLKKAIELDDNFYQAHKDLAYLKLAQAMAEFSRVTAILPKGHPYRQYAIENSEQIRDMVGTQSRVCPGHLTGIVSNNGGGNGTT